MMGKPAYHRNQKAAEKEIEAIPAAFFEIYETYARRNEDSLESQAVTPASVKNHINVAAPVYAQFVKKTMDADPDIVTKAVARQFAELIEAPLGELAKAPLVAHLMCDNTTEEKYYSHNWKGQLMDEMAPLVGKETHGTIEYQQPVLDAEWIVTWIKIQCPDAWEAVQKTPTNTIQVPVTFFDTIDRVIEGRLPFRDQMIEHDKASLKFDPNYPKPFTGVAYRCSASNQETLPIFTQDFDDTAYIPETRPAPAPYTAYVHTRRDTPGGQSVHTEASQSIPLQPQKNRDLQHSKSTKPIINIPYQGGLLDK
ncbi:hypothetical protein FPANT_4006 [Fusarium pseudoanthophilum]|uniref:Uncharacterized protein n=1 Tax=Fusarium pseudoanthophilum TaxID=48495 RepID=A0A8H5PK28_9HYPO|nr:hypothetical protein FPANT_4006 [Fusarium pseudoanthophilum]